MCRTLWNCTKCVSYGPMSVCFVIFVLYEAKDMLLHCVSCSARINSAAGCAQAILSTQALISRLSSIHFSAQLSHPLLIPLHHSGSLTFHDFLLFSTLSSSVFSLFDFPLLIFFLHFKK